MLGGEYLLQALLGDPHENGAWTIKETATHLVQIVPQPYNTKVALTPKDCVYVYDDSW